MVFTHFIEVQIASGIWCAEATLTLMTSKIEEECAGEKMVDKDVRLKIDGSVEEWGNVVVPRLERATMAP